MKLKSPRRRHRKRRNKLKRLRKEYKRKVYVTVHYSRWKNYRDRERIKSSDIAGQYITIFSANGIREGKLACDMHFEGLTTTIARVEVPISTYTARRLETPIKRFISKCKKWTFLGPAYRNKMFKEGDSDSKRVDDTQLYVSGSIEETDKTPNHAAYREVEEEIGLPVFHIRLMQVDKFGNHWFHVDV